MNLVELPLDGIERREVLAQRDNLPEVGVGAFAHLRLALLQLQGAHLLAQTGQAVAVDNLQTGEEGLHGRDATHDAALDQRQGHRDASHLGDGHVEAGLDEPVLGLEDSARSRNLREVVGEGLAPALCGGLEVEPRVGQRAVMFHGGGPALLEREGLGSGRKASAEEQQKQCCKCASHRHL